MVYVRNIFALILIFCLTFQAKSQCLFNYDLGPDVYLCSGDSIQLITPVGYVYSWTPNYNISSNNVSSPYVKPDVDTTYYVSVTDANNCTVFDSINVFGFTFGVVNETDHY